MKKNGIILANILLMLSILAVVILYSTQKPSTASGPSPSKREALGSPCGGAVITVYGDD